MKRIQIQLMNHEFRTLAAEEAKQLLNSKGFRHIEICSHFCVSIKMIDLEEVYFINGHHLLDDLGNEMSRIEINNTLSAEGLLRE